MTNRTDSIIRHIGTPRTLPPMERNPLQQALDNYHEMESERDKARAEAANLRATNSALLAETGMLREAYERADTDRIRLQTISSTLLGRLLAINDCIAGAVKASIREGIEASAKPDDLEQAGAEAAAILQRVVPEPGMSGFDSTETYPEPPHGQERAIPPRVEWRR